MMEKYYGNISKLAPYARTCFTREKQSVRARPIRMCAAHLSPESVCWFYVQCCKGTATVPPVFVQSFIKIKATAILEEERRKGGMLMSRCHSRREGRAAANGARAASIATDIDGVKP